MDEKIYKIKKQDLTNIADAIRYKNGTTQSYTVAAMPEAIKLNTGGSAYVVDGEQTLLITGTYQGTSLIITENTLINLRAYLEQKEIPLDIEIAVNENLVPQGTIEITTNGEHNVAYKSIANVNVPIPEGYIKPEGNINITNTAEVDVTNYATAQVSDDNLISENIAENVTILGITGTFKGGGSSEGIAINGDIVSYLAKETIAAGDFVEFISQRYQVDDLWDSIDGASSCVAIDDNTVFITYKDSYAELYGTVVKLADDGQITFYSNTISSECYADPIATLIDTNKVLIVTGDKGEYRSIKLVEINETTATLKASKDNSDRGNNNWGRNIVTIAPNKAFFAYEYTNDMDLVFSGLAGTVIEVNGNTISEYNTILSDTENACCNQPYCIALENNKVFIAIANGEDRKLYGRIYEINGATPQYVVSSLIQDSYSYGIDYQVATKLNDNKLFIAYRSENQENVLVSEIIDINGTTIDHVTTQLTSEMDNVNIVYSCEVISSDDDKEIYEVLVAYTKGTSLQCIKVKVNQSEIEQITPIELQITKQYDCNEVSSVKLGDNIFLAHYVYDNNNYVSLLGVTVYENPAAILTKNTIDGVAKTSGQEGDIIEIYVPHNIN